MSKDTQTRRIGGACAHPDLKQPARASPVLDSRSTCRACHPRCRMESATVAKTRAEQLEYGRGYNRGIARAQDRFKAVVEIAKGYRRAARGEGPQESLCKNCDRWKRGEGNAHWGRCRADFEWDLEPRMWADAWPAKEKA